MNKITPPNKQLHARIRIKVFKSFWVGILYES